MTGFNMQGDDPRAAYDPRDADLAAEHDERQAELEELMADAAAVTVGQMAALYRAGPSRVLALLETLRDSTLSDADARRLALRVLVLDPDEQRRRALAGR